MDWHAEMLKWGRAEGMELKREEYRGLRKVPLSMEWNTIVIDYSNVDIQAY